MKNKPQLKTNLIVALDYTHAQDAIGMVRTLGDSCDWYKVGMQLFFSEGEPIIRYLKQQGKQIFLDLKLNDIPNTVSNALLSLKRYEPDLLTLFTSELTLKAARETVDRYDLKSKLLNVTVLTSETNGRDALSRAKMSINAGAHGIVCSALETAQIRRQLQGDYLVVNPGIRLPGNSNDDQTRVAGPAEAAEAGASYVVVGRPITKAEDPVEMVEKILDQLS